MKHVCALLRDHPSLQKTNAAADERIADLKKRSEWVYSQMKALTDEAQDRQKTFWNEIEAYLANESLYPPWYIKGKHHLHFDDTVGAVIACDKDDGCDGNAKAAMAKALFSTLFS